MEDTPEDLIVNDDDLIFTDDNQKDAADEAADHWKVMIVDDEARVHDATRLILEEFTFDGKPLTIISAHSGEEAKRLIEAHPDTALILLDVVMEENDSGLKVVEHVREALGNKFVRLVIRTGQPGKAPEETVVQGYDINDYKLKTELTLPKLYTTIVTALRAYRNLTTIETDRKELAKLYASLEEHSAELKKANEQLQQEIAERKKAEEKYRSIFENAVEGIFQTTPDGRILSANPAVARMLGYNSPEELMAGVTDTQQQLYVNPSRREEYIRLMRAGRPVFGFEVQLYCKGGGMIWGSIHSRPVYDENDELLFIEGMIDNITERKRAEEEKEKMQAQLLQIQKMEAIGVLAGGVAHDFNNLLTTILGYVELAMESVDEAEPLYNDLKRVTLAATRAANLTRQLLLFSRKQPMETTSLDINETTRHLLRMLERLIGEDITITINLDPDLWVIRADAGTIEQVIMNLAINARDAMPAGGKLTIKTKNIVLDEAHSKIIPDARPGKFICLSVEDTGGGIDPESMSHIFEPFFTTKEMGQGTGLGLSVVYGIITQRQGWINVYSEGGQGSVFKVYLPASLAGQPQVEVEEKMPLKDLQGRNERILLIEDEEEVRKFARRVLVPNGYVVFEAANAGEALDIFEQEDGNFDLIFSDVVLPDQNGLELIDQLLSRRPKLQVLLSSGYTDTKSQWPIIRERGFPFLQKPYRVPGLLRAIKKLLIE